ncbi:MAG: ABC transporter permease [Clostridiales bacterium]|nr:ABC transporter permease [Clostridiales bacterium]MCF8023455.1 ABC transporter permease [Clostridiales bacterium]
MKLHRLLSITRKEFIQIKRDRPSLVISFIMPVMMLLLFGYAVTTDVDNISMVVLDQDNHKPGREIVSAFKNTGYYSPVTYVNNIKKLEDKLDKGAVKSGLIIPVGYAQNIRREEPAQIQYLVDGSDPLIARTALNMAKITVQNLNRNIQIQNLNSRGIALSETPPVDLRTRAYYNPGLESLKFNVPGLIGLVLQNITVMLTAFTLVRERERGTLEQLMVTPLKNFELMLGKLIPYILIAFIDVALVLGVGVWWFKVPIRGNLLLLLVLSLLFLIFALGLGILFSTLARTQLQAMQMTMLFILPSVILSGFVFPRESMPDIIRWLGYGIPLTYYLEILRGIMLKGVGLIKLWNDIIPLTAFGFVTIALASLRFRKKVE